MKMAIGVMLILFAACSCAPERVASWSVRTDQIVAYDEERTEGQLQELLDLERERYRTEIVARRAKAGLRREAKCPRCYRTVYLTDTVRKGDEVRCGHCGKTFVLE